MSTRNISSSSSDIEKEDEALNTLNNLNTLNTKVKSDSEKKENASVEKEEKNKKNRIENGLRNLQTITCEIKKNKNAYMFYTIENRDKIKAENSKLKKMEILHLLSEKWQGMPAKEKERYVGLAKRDKERYERELYNMGMNINESKGANIKKKQKKENLVDKKFKKIIQTEDSD